MKAACSVPILTLNSRPGLERLLPLLIPVFDDVFIIDGNSTDGTREYAASLGVRVEDQFTHQEPNAPIKDFSKVRERSWSFAKCDWIFYLDSDEWSTQELLQKVVEIVEVNEVKTVHEFCRKACLPGGEVVERAFFYPEYCLRLFARSSGAHLRERPVHERMILPTGVVTEKHNEFFYAQWPDPVVFWQKQKKYLALEEGARVNPSLTWFVRWGIVYNIGMLVKQSIRSFALLISSPLFSAKTLPWVYIKRFLGYRVLAMRSVYRAWSRTRNHA